MGRALGAGAMDGLLPCGRTSPRGVRVLFAAHPSLALSVSHFRG